MGKEVIVAAPEPETPPARQLALFTDQLFQPFVVLTLIGATIVQLLTSNAQPTSLEKWLLVPVFVLGIFNVLPWTRVPTWQQITAVALYGLLAGALFPLLSYTAAPGFAFLATVIAGERLASRSAALWIAVGTAITATLSLVVFDLATDAHTGWPWWLAPAVGAPVYIGIARRERRAALSAATAALNEAERARASEAREAALEERARIASEIHDVIGHSLSGIALQLEVADALHGDHRDAEANNAVRRARKMAVSGLSETRRAIHALAVDSPPVDQVLREVTKNFGASFQVIGSVEKLNADMEQAITRTTQEALTNVERHAPGAKISVVLRFEPRRVEVTIRNGEAKRTASPDDAGVGMGLAGMRERAMLLGGSLEARPVDENNSDVGWLTRLELPR